jgi:spermidine synthase
MRDAGFARTDVVDLSADVLALGARHFREINGDVLASPRVHAFVNDGRNFLMLSQRSYDVVAVEISSIWFAGGSALYDRDFYAIVKRRLAPGGVLEQWIQLHRLAPLDLVSIIATVRSEFSDVWLYYAGTQGMIVACDAPCAPQPASVAALDATPALQEILGLYGGSKAILGSLLLDREGIARLLASVPDVDDLVSTDDNLLLEYETPRANVRPLTPTLVANVMYLRSFSGGGPR